MLFFLQTAFCADQGAVLLQAPMVAKGFRFCVHKWLTVIRLLLGEMPSIGELNAPGTNLTMQPYVALTAAVRSGDVTAFNGVAAKNSKIFLLDQTHNLINRLRYNVLRAGLRRISLAYSRISLQVCKCESCVPQVRKCNQRLHRNLQRAGMPQCRTNTWSVSC